MIELHDCWCSASTEGEALVTSCGICLVLSHFPFLPTFLEWWLRSLLEVRKWGHQITRNWSESPARPINRSTKWKYTPNGTFNWINSIRRHGRSSTRISTETLSIYALLSCFYRNSCGGDKSSRDSCLPKYQHSLRVWYNLEGGEQLTRRIQVSREMMKGLLFFLLLTLGAFSGIVLLIPTVMLILVHSKRVIGWRRRYVSFISGAIRTS